MELRRRLPDQHRQTPWLHRFRAKARSNRGVAIVEAAFITPVFFALVLGVMEGGLYMKDYLSMSNAVRAGARSASAAGADGEADLYTLFDINNESSALGANQIQYVVIYKATGPSATLSSVNTTCLAGTSVNNVCNVYYPADIAKAVAQVKELTDQAEALAAGQTRTLNADKIWFGCLTVGVHANASPDRYWCPGSRADARSSNNKTGPDYVGVWMKVNHGWVTKMFGNTATMTDQSVIQIEPRST